MKKKEKKVMRKCFWGCLRIVAVKWKLVFIVEMIENLNKIQIKLNKLKTLKKYRLNKY